MAIAGRITVDGKPGAGITVELLKDDPDSSRRVLVTKVTTGKTGRYIIKGIAPGIYDVSPSAPTLVVPAEGKFNQSGKTIIVEAGEAASQIDFELISKGSIAGRVFDINGQPIAGETVSLIRVGENGYRSELILPQSDGLKTDERGNYNIAGVPPGKYLVSVGVPFGLAAYGIGDKEGPHYPQTFHPDAEDPSKVSTVEVNFGRQTDDVDITVARPLKAYEIAGQIIDAETATPIPNVRLGVITQSNNGKFIHDQTGPWQTDSNGQFRVRGALAGHYTVYPVNDSASNTYGDAISFDIKDSDVTGLQIPMHRASTISGRVIIEGESAPLIADEFSKVRVFARRLFIEKDDAAQLNVNPPRRLYVLTVRFA